jgi:non-ribosomal peptide synthetase component F
VGTSFIRYRDRGFWSRDASIELWLYLLAQEVRGFDDPPEWLRSAAEDWQLQATLGMVGCISAGLDEYASTPERAAVIQRLAERALAGLRERGEMVPAAWLNALGLGGPEASFTRDVSTEVFTPVGEAFIRLLRGEITWDAATSPLL